MLFRFYGKHEYTYSLKAVIIICNLAVLYSRFQLLYSTTKTRKKKAFDFRGEKNRNLLIKNKIINH